MNHTNYARQETEIFFAYCVLGIHVLVAHAVYERYRCVDASVSGELYAVFLVDGGVLDQL